MVFAIHLVTFFEACSIYFIYYFSPTNKKKNKNMVDKNHYELVYVVPALIVVISLAYQLKVTVFHKKTDIPPPISLVYLSLTLFATLFFTVYGILLFCESEDGRYDGIGMIVFDGIRVVLLTAIIGVVVHSGKIIS
jgi:uncharacterized protein with PQ loop repeat